MDELAIAQAIVAAAEQRVVSGDQLVVESIDVSEGELPISEG
jgi:hypothetical protein